MSDETRIIRGGTTPPRGLLSPGELVVNSYRVVRLVATGGMGALYEGEHDITHDRVAIKAILDEHARDPLISQMFEREAIALKKIRHEAVVGYRDILRDQHGRLFLIMDFVEGGSLSDRLKRGPLSEAETLALGARLAGGLGAAHRVGVVHRDMSPSNVLLPGGDINRAIIIDFGIAKTIGSEQVSLIGDSFAGKIRYAAPEQLGHYGGKVDHRADIYSLGMTLAESAGVQPPGAANLAEAIAIRQHDVTLDLAPDSIRQRVEPMLRADPSRRPNDIAAAWASAPAAPAAPAPGPTPLRAPAESGRFAEMAREASAEKAGEKSGGGALIYAGVAVFILAAVGFFGWTQRDKILGGDEPVAAAPATAPAGETAPQAGGGAAAPAAVAATIPKPPPDPNAASIVQVSTAEEALGRGPDEAMRIAGDLQAKGGADNLNIAFAVYRELANGGSLPAAMAVARMYDPETFSTATSPFTKPSVRSAKRWYEKAAELGSTEAAEALQRLANQ